MQPRDRGLAQIERAEECRARAERLVTSPIRRLLRTFALTLALVPLGVVVGLLMLRGPSILLALVLLFYGALTGEAVDWTSLGGGVVEGVLAWCAIIGVLLLASFSWLLSRKLALRARVLPVLTHGAARKAVIGSVSTSTIRKGGMDRAWLRAQILADTSGEVIAEGFAEEPPGTPLPSVPVGSPVWLWSCRDQSIVVLESAVLDARLLTPTPAISRS